MYKFIHTLTQSFYIAKTADAIMILCTHTHKQQQCGMQLKYLLTVHHHPRKGGAGLVALKLKYMYCRL